MKRTYIALAALVSLSVMSAAQASDGTINFGGKLFNQTCTISVNGGTSMGTVTLPTLLVSAFGVAGATGGSTVFNIGLSGCGGGSSSGVLSDSALNGTASNPKSISSASAYFENGPSIDPISHNVLNANGSATGVQLQLTDFAGKVIRPGDISQLTVQGVGIGAGGSTSGTMRYKIQYIATAAATVGSVVGSVTYSVAYY